ncbi:MAG: hypothetical protein J6S76_07660 [Clostridia bacterium]|nr:hypothetical protein [Clostridia bacterium]
MRSRTFWILLWAVILLCTLATAAHIVYAADAYQRCSIIYFVGEELW